MLRRFHFVERDASSGHSRVVAVATVNDGSVNWDRGKEIRAWLAKERFPKLPNGFDESNIEHWALLPQLLSGDYFWVREDVSDEAIERGGPGSGNHGHRGLKGVHGGSSPAGGTASGLTPEILANNEIIWEPTGEPDKDEDLTLGGISTSYMVRVFGPNREDLGNAIVKSDMNPPNSYAGEPQREEAVYKLSQALGFDNVPTTAVREGGDTAYPYPGEYKEEYEASIQEWVEDSWLGSEMVPDDWDEMDMQSYSQMVMLDHLGWNTDRHYGNFLFKDNKIIAIDNDHSFSGYSPDPQHLHNKFMNGIRRYLYNLPFSDGTNNTDFPVLFSQRDVDAVIDLPNNTEFKDYFLDTFGKVEWEELSDRVAFVELNRDKLIEGVHVDTIWRHLESND